MSVKYYWHMYAQISTFLACIARTRMACLAFFLYQQVVGMTGAPACAELSLIEIAAYEHVNISVYIIHTCTLFPMLHTYTCLALQCMYKCYCCHQVAKSSSTFISQNDKNCHVLNCLYLFVQKKCCQCCVTSIMWRVIFIYIYGGCFVFYAHVAICTSYCAVLCLKCDILHMHFYTFLLSCVFIKMQAFGSGSIFHVIQLVVCNF